MTVNKPKTGKAGNAQKTADKATLKMHNDVTASLQQLEHPAMKAKKKPKYSSVNLIGDGLFSSSVKSNHHPPS
jgi:hypothetical protein